MPKQSNTQKTHQQQAGSACSSNSTETSQVDAEESERLYEHLRIAYEAIQESLQVSSDSIVPSPSKKQRTPLPTDLHELCQRASQVLAKQGSMSSHAELSSLCEAMTQALLKQETWLNHLSKTFKPQDRHTWPVITATNQKRFTFALASALRSNSSLTHLNLAWNQFGLGGATALARALKSHNCLTRLDLGSNELGPEGTIALAFALKSHSSLTHLSIWRNNLGLEGAAALASALRSHSSLTHLDLVGNELGSEGARFLAKVLKNNNRLTHLNLSWNKLGSEGTTALAFALKSNSHLTNLNLALNNLDSEDTRFLAKALKSNNRLTHLDLSWNKLGPKGAATLALALKSNSHLTDLNLEGNDLGPEGALTLAAALKINNSLTHLDLGSNQLGSEGAPALAAIDKYLDRNRRNHFIKNLSLQQLIYAHIQANPAMKDAYAKANQALLSNLAPWFTALTREQKQWLPTPQASLTISTNPLAINQASLFYQAAPGDNPLTDKPTNSPQKSPHVCQIQ